ncbi:MAG TPA: SemiSWEET transporter [Prochlorococcaceae cyanobacterium AMR_MDS_5431]|nr:SemiSWEET transporter [Prochlorococcaceae cyanobacterium AMR_MDS_5431]
MATTPLPLELLGYGAAILTTASFFPQALKTLKSGDTSAISLRMYALFTLGVACWGIYGALTGNGPVLVANAVTLLPAGIVLERKIRAEQTRLGLAWRKRGQDEET